MSGDGTQQFWNAFVSLATDGVEFVTEMSEMIAQAFDFRFYVRFIAFIEDDDLLFFGEFVTECGEFEVQSVKILDGIAVGFGTIELVGDFDEMDENSGPFEVFEEIESEAFSVACADDESWDIGDDEVKIFVNLNDAEVWDECCEWVVGNFGFCV